MIRRVVWADAAQHTAAILEAIAEQRRQHPGAKLNVGGRWAGPKILFTDPAVADLVAPLRRWLEDELDVDPEKGITGWGLVVETGDVIEKHKHERSAQWGTNRYAGTYCVTCPPLADGSSRLTAYEADETARTFDPTPGAAVVFDALTFHESAAHREPEPRVMVAFSVA